MFNHLRKKPSKKGMPAAYRPNLVPSLDSGTSETSKRETTKYTGNYITGITVTHKSNLMPVSKGEDPTIYAQMRRN